MTVTLEGGVTIQQASPATRSQSQTNLGEAPAPLSLEESVGKRIQQLERQQHQLRGTPAAAEHGAEHGAADNENDGAWSASNDGERGGGNFGDEET